MIYKADWRSLFFISLAICFQVCVFIFSSHMNFWTLLLLLFINVFIVFQISLINHNHRHHRIFHSNTLNRIVDLVITFLILAPSTRLHAVHVLNHHAHFDSDEDWTTYKIATKHTSGIMRSFEYLKNASTKIFTLRQSLELSAAMKRELQQELWALCLYALILIIIAPQILIFWLLPSATLGLLLLLLANLINHDQCDLQSDFNHAHNFTSSFENFWLCNNGFHTPHHLNPGMHWSLYPAYYQNEVLHQMDPQYQSAFFVRRLLRYLSKGVSS